MSASEKLSPPFTFVFSPQAKLVSFSKSLKDSLYPGSSFGDIFLNESKYAFAALVAEKNIPETLHFGQAGLSYAFSSHLLKDPEDRLLALIITLLSSESSAPALPDIDDKMIRMDRLAQIGQLASSIAHEIRNPLAGINANVQVLNDMLAGESSFKKFFDVILEEIQRIEKIIKDLLNYSRQSKPIFEKISVEKIFEHVNTLISHQLHKKNVRLKFQSDTAIPLITADSGQLIQIFLNCIFNAAEAMPEGGDVIVKCSSLNETGEVSISFKDTGIGINNDIRERIFEPFFTTRAKGLGLGLSVVRKIMDDHNGKIVIDSQEGQGTEVSLMFHP